VYAFHARPHANVTLSDSNSSKCDQKEYTFQLQDLQLRLCKLVCSTFFRCRGQLKCDGTRAETRFRLSAKRTDPFKSAGASVQSTTGSRGVRISGSNAGYTMFRGSVKSTGYPLHSPVSPSLPLPCVTVCHHISTGVYLQRRGSMPIQFIARRAMFVYSNIQARSCKHCCGGKAIRITYSECVFVALGIQHEMSMGHIAIYGLTGYTIFFYSLTTA